MVIQVTPVSVPRSPLPRGVLSPAEPGHRVTPNTFRESSEGRLHTTNRTGGEQNGREKIREEERKQASVRKETFEAR